MPNYTKLSQKSRDELLYQLANDLIDFRSKWPVIRVAQAFGIKRPTLYDRAKKSVKSTK